MGKVNNGLDYLLALNNYLADQKPLSAKRSGVYPTDEESFTEPEIASRNTGGRARLRAGGVRCNRQSDTHPSAIDDVNQR
jgi:hypothetical protein